MKLFDLKNWKSLLTITGLLMMVVVFTQCSDDEEPDTPVAVTAAFDTGTIDGLTVSFINASINGASYTWDFGDGNTSTDSDPTHTYAADGVYTVTLTAKNGENEDMATKDVEVRTPVFKNFIAGKTWIHIRENSFAYHLGPDDGSWTWDHNGAAPWFNWGDLQDMDGNFLGTQSLQQRISLANDEYTFNVDGSYNINFNGDFWGEFGIWAGTAFNEVDIALVDDKLPPRADGVDVSAFVNTTQNYVIDEVAGTLQVIGEGAHISNPRYKNNSSSYDVGNGITYTIHHIAEGPTADTLVLFNTTLDNDFNATNEHYITLANYKNGYPDIRDNSGGFVPVDYADEISSEDMWHMFDTENNYGSGVDEILTSSIVTYGVMQDGETCTQFTRTDADGGFTDYKLFSRDADIRFDDAGMYTFSKAQIDVYIPSTNDFGGDLVNQVEIILADESGDDDGQEGGPGFWCCWQIESIEDTPLDSWQTLTFDFTGDLDDMDAASGIRDDIDLIIIRFGGSGHTAGGDFYMKNFKFIQ